MATPKFERETFFQAAPADDSAARVAAGLASALKGFQNTATDLAIGFAKDAVPGLELEGMKAGKAAKDEGIPTGPALEQGTGIQSAAFNKGAIQAYGAEVKQDFRSRLVQLKEEFSDDPAEFRNQAGAHIVGMMNGLPEEIAVPLSGDLEELFERTSLSVQEGFFRQQKAEQAGVVEAELETLFDGISNTARQGIDPTGELSKFDKEVDDAVAGRLISPTQGEQRKEAAREVITQETYFNEIETLLDEGDPAQALASAKQRQNELRKSTFEDMTAQQRDALINKGDALIGARERALAESIKVGAQKNLVNEALIGNIDLDSKNPVHQKAVESYYQSTLVPILDTIDDPNLRASLETNYIELTRVVPESIATRIRGGLQSGNPSSMIAAADAIDRLQNLTVPGLNITSGKLGLTNDDMARANLINDRLASGTDPDEAVRLAIEQVNPQNKAAREARKAQIKNEGYLADVPSWTQGFIDENLDSFFTSDAEIIDVGGLEANMINDYATSFQLNFEISGNLELAKKMTETSMANKWSKTGIEGQSRVMAYAPNNYYAISGDDDKWMQLQLADDMTQYFAGQGMSDIVKMMEDGNMYITSDAVTGRQASGDNPQPTYSILWRDDNGLFLPVSTGEGQVRWKPDPNRVINQNTKNAVREARTQRESETFRMKEELRKATSPFVTGPKY